MRKYFILILLTLVGLAYIFIFMIKNTRFESNLISCENGQVSFQITYKKLNQNIMRLLNLIGLVRRSFMHLIVLTYFVKIMSSILNMGGQKIHLILMYGMMIKDCGMNNTLIQVRGYTYESEIWRFISKASYYIFHMDLYSIYI